MPYHIENLRRFYSLTGLSVAVQKRLSYVLDCPSAGGDSELLEAFIQRPQATKGSQPDLCVASCLGAKSFIESVY